jgi:nucleoside-diphosphate-sugar epimerase
MESSCTEPLNIGSEQMVTINELATIAITLSGKNLSIDNIQGDDFYSKYGFECPVGVRGRNSDNALYLKNIGWSVENNLELGMERTYPWIDSQTKINGDSL